jgi:hypothetical protein
MQSDTAVGPGPNHRESLLVGGGESRGDEVLCEKTLGESAKTTLLPGRDLAW